MCLLAFAYRTHPAYPFILVANRDEFYARPTREAGYWLEHADLLAGKDLEQGGTWLGLTRQGRLATVTNYRDGSRPFKTQRSRGGLTLEFLTGDTTAERYCQQVLADVQGYGGFNLICADDKGVCYVSSESGNMEVLGSGVYALSNAYLNTPWPKTRSAADAMRGLLVQQQIEVTEVADLLSDNNQAADHDLPQTGVSAEWEKLLSSAFIRSDHYGTRSTSVVLQTMDGELQFYERSHAADGTICEKFYQLNVPLIGGGG